MTPVKAGVYAFSMGGECRVFLAIAWIATALFLTFTFAGHGPSTYRYAICFLGPFLWGVYFLRQQLFLHPLHFGIFAAALVFHNLGAFGAYGKFFLNLEFDTYVHFFFGVAGGLIVARGLCLGFGLEGWKLWVGAVLVILGIGAIHELIEFGSTLVLGGEKGMLKTNDPDKFDTQKDLFNNLCGVLVANFFYSLGLGNSRAAAPVREEFAASPQVRQSRD